MRLKKIAIISTNRADYYLLSQVIKDLKKKAFLDAYLIVTGSHVLSSFGETKNDIEQKIDYIANLKDITPGSSTNEILVSVIEQINEILVEVNFDYVLLLGDRFEVAGIALACFNINLPIIHLYGGEVTSGSKDNHYRNIISMLSSHHFVSNIDYKKNLVKLGIDPNVIYEVGYITSDLIKNISYLSKNDLMQSLGIVIDGFKYIAIISLHPTTNENTTIDGQIELIKNMVSQYKDIFFIATAANIDHGGDRINQWFEVANKTIKNFSYVKNLGFTRYINLIKNSDFVIGNSSSLVIDVPLLGKQSILLGDRQAGRIILGKVINCSYDSNEVFSAIETTLNFSNVYESPTNLQDYSSSDLIVGKITQIMTEINK